MDMDEAEEKADPPDAKTKAKLAKTRSARMRVLQAYLDIDSGRSSKRYADPAVSGRRGEIREQVVWKASDG